MKYEANRGETTAKATTESEQIQIQMPDQDRIKSCQLEKENITIINTLQSSKQTPVREIVWFSASSSQGVVGELAASAALVL